MGRGTSKSRGGGGAREVKNPDGSVIDLADSPLIYGNNDSAVSGNARSVIEQWEAKRVKNKLEYNMSVDQDGNQIGAEVKGGKTSVRVPLSHLQEGAIHTHIHPRDDNSVLGGTFSEADLKNFANHGVSTYRAKAKEGAYSISKSKNFDAAGFKSYVYNLYSKEQTASESAMKALRDKVRKDSSYTYSSYVKDANKAFNALLVAMHNGLIAGQQKYGYNYTLER